MSAEKFAADAAFKTAQAVEKGAEQLIKKVWSVMEAAAEKPKASEYLSPTGIRALQGKDR